MGSVIYLVFMGFVPVVLIILKMKGKITSGFTTSGIMAAFLIALILNASIQPDPHKEFIKAINSKDAKIFAKAKMNLRIIVQNGSDSFNKIDERLINDKNKFTNLKLDLVDYYNKTVRKSIDNKTVTIENCDNYFVLRKELDQLQFGNMMLKYSGLLGGDPLVIDGLKTELDIIILAKKPIVEKLFVTCEID